MSHVSRQLYFTKLPKRNEISCRFVSNRDLICVISFRFVSSKIAKQGFSIRFVSKEIGTGVISFRFVSNVPRKPAFRFVSFRTQKTSFRTTLVITSESTSARKIGTPNREEPRTPALLATRQYFRTNVVKSDQSLSAERSKVSETF